MPATLSDQTATSGSASAPLPQSKPSLLPAASISRSSLDRTNTDPKSKPKQARKKPFKSRARQLGRRKREGSADNDEEQGPSSRASRPILRSDSGSFTLNDQGRLRNTHIDTDDDDDDDVEVTFGAPPGRKELRLGLASSRQNSSTSISKGKGRESPVKTTLDLATAKLPRTLQLPSPPSSNASNVSTSNSAIPILPPPESSSADTPASKNSKKKRNKKPVANLPSQTNTLSISEISKPLAKSTTSPNDQQTSSEKQTAGPRDQPVSHTNIDSSLPNLDASTTSTTGQPNDPTIADEIPKKKKKNSRQKMRERKEREAAATASHQMSPEGGVSPDSAPGTPVSAVPSHSIKPSIPTLLAKPSISSKSRSKDVVNKGGSISTGRSNTGVLEATQIRPSPPVQQLSYTAEKRQQAAELRMRRATEKNPLPTSSLSVTHTQPTPTVSNTIGLPSAKNQVIPEPSEVDTSAPRLKSKNALKRERLERKKEKLAVAGATQGIHTTEKATPKAKAARKGEGNMSMPNGEKGEVGLGGMSKERLPKGKEKRKEKGKEKAKAKGKEKEKENKRTADVQVVEVVKEGVTEKINEVEFGYIQQQQQQRQQHEATKASDFAVPSRAEPTSPALSTLERTILSHPPEHVSSPMLDESPRFGSIAGPTPVSFAEGPLRPSNSHIAPAAYPQLNTPYQQPSPNMLSNLIVPPGYLLDSGIYYDQQTGQPYIYAYPSQTQPAPFYPSLPIHNAPSVQPPPAHQHWAQPRLSMDQTSPMYYTNMFPSNLSVPPLGYPPSLNDLQNSYAAAQLGNMMAESMAAASYQPSVSLGPSRMSHLSQMHHQQQPSSSSSSASSSVSASPLFVPRRQGSSAVKVKMDDGSC